MGFLERGIPSLIGAMIGDVLNIERLRK